MQKEYYVYVIRCRDGTYYTGITNDYEARFSQHQMGFDKHAYTYSRRPLELYFVEFYEDINDAISREKQLKRWSRGKKEALAKQDWKKLMDLAKKRFQHV